MSLGRRARDGTIALAFLIASWACADTVTSRFEEVEAIPCAPAENPLAFPDLPLRGPPAAVTTGRVPHQQINPDIFPDVITVMGRRIFALPEVESRPSTIVDGATAIWLGSEFDLQRPECVIRDRELGHIHLDGSLHVTLPHGRIPGAVTAGWVERHPWSGTRPGFESYVMIFSPRDLGEVAVIVDLLVDGISFVGGA